MELIKLNFSADICGESRNFTVEVPYKDGIVATSEFCPTDLLSGSVNLMAAVRGESLDKFMADCRKQLMAMSQINEVETDLDRHIGGLMAAVMDHFSRNEKIDYGDLLIYVDCFSLLLKASGFDGEEIRTIYPRVAKSIIDLYPEYVNNVPAHS